MDISPIVVTVVLTALVDFTNGFHDTANAMAISIATGALRPRVAVGIAAVPDLAGAFLSVRPRGRSPGVWSVTGKIVLPALVADVRVVPEPGPVGLTVR
jgi:PiT family inorganic phosphate transporter